jgi:hypothetical protein
MFGYEKWGNGVWLPVREYARKEQVNFARGSDGAEDAV